MRILTIALILTFFSAAAGARAEDSSLTALTQVPVWLNTQRALRPVDLKGRIILVDFWTYCCINCLHVFPDLKALEKEFGDEITVIGVHSAKFDNEKDRENIRQAILRNEISHPVVDDADFAIWKHFGVSSWPTLLLIDPTGQVDISLAGEGHLQELRAHLRALVDKFRGELVKGPLPLELERTKAPPTTLRFPAKLAFTSDYQGAPALFISDSNHNRIVAIRPDSGQIILSIGSKEESGFVDGNFSDARFSHPQGILYRDGMLYVADLENHALRSIDLKENRVVTLAGTGKQGYLRTPHESSARTAALSSPWDLAFFPTDRQIAIAMAGTHQIWTYDLDKKSLNLLAGTGVENIVDGPASTSALAQTSGLSVSDNKLYFVDAETSSLRVLDKKEIHTLVGSGLFHFGFKDGVKSQALLQHPLGLYADHNLIYIADSFNHSLRVFNTTTLKLSTIAGNGTRGSKNGVGDKAQFNEPNALMRDGNRLYVADTNNQTIRVVDLKTKTVSTLEVKEGQHPSHRQISETLPNLIRGSELTTAAGKPIAVKVVLPNDWKINATAPSFLALFQVTPKGTELVAQWDRNALKNKTITLPELLTTAPYRLQGTFYYCKEAANSLCLIESHDQIVKAEASSNATTIPISLTIR